MRRRCVFDTNSLISALLIRSSVSRAAFDKALDHYLILISDETATEFENVAGREKFEVYLRPNEREQFEDMLLREATYVEPTETIQACRDPDDNKFLELAVAGNADIIISGDTDLLELDPFRGIRIVTPRTFVDTFPPLANS